MNQDQVPVELKISNPYAGLSGSLFGDTRKQHEKEVDYMPYQDVLDEYIKIQAKTSTFSRAKRDYICKVFSIMQRAYQEGKLNVHLSDEHFALFATQEEIDFFNKTKTDNEEV